MNEQTKLESIIETTLNIISGFVISMLVWSFIVVPIYGFENNTGQAFSITVIFTITSFIRGYYWRRFFAIGLHKKVHQIITKLYK